MKYIFSELPRLKNKIKNSRHTTFLLDFDGTLSAIVPQPNDARLTEKTRQLLKKINKRFPVAIITGRPLGVIKKKIGVKEFAYAASHGLEWNFNGKFKQKSLPKSVMAKLNRYRKILETAHFKHFPSLLIEDKHYALTLHYHLMPGQQKKIFTTWLKNFLKPIYAQSATLIFHDKETVEILPNLKWDKGDVAKLVLKYFRQKYHVDFLPIYIGDTTTDENAFRALPNGITIRVGKSKNSAARYYLRNQKEVQKFLNYFLATNPLINPQP